MAPSVFFFILDDNMDIVEKPKAIITFKIRIAITIPGCEAPSTTKLLSRVAILK